MKAITLVKAWLRKPGNTKAKLAVRLGYETSNAISKWVERDSIPKHQESRVLLILGASHVKDTKIEPE